jgi:hypothetical protein
MNLFNYQWRLLNAKKNDFVKIKLRLNENIEWHCMQFELNWIELLKFELNWIELLKFELNWIF